MNLWNLYRAIKQKEDLGTKGWLSCNFREKEGDEWIPLWQIPVKNLITFVGVAQAVKCWGDGATAVFGWGAVGTGTDAPADGDTTLQTEVDRQVAAFSQITTTITNDTGQWVSTHEAPAGGWDITEYALVNAAAAGVIYNRVTFTAIHLDEGNQLQFTYQSQLTRI